MRKLLLLLAVLVVALFSVSVSTGESTGFYLSPHGDSVRNVVLADSGFLLVMTDNSFYRVNTQTGQWTFLCDRTDGMGTSYYGEDGGIYTFLGQQSAEKTEMLRLDQASGQWEVAYSMPMPMGREYPGFPMTGYWMNGMFYFLCYKDDMPTSLCAYDPETDETTDLGDFGMAEGDNVLIHTGDKLIALAKDRQNLLSYLYEFDLSTKQIERTKLNGDLFYLIAALAYDVSTGTYYATVSDPVNTKPFSLYRGSSLETLEPYITPTERNDLLAADGVCYMVRPGRITTDKAAAQVERKLTIANFRTERDGAYTGKTNTAIFETGSLPQDIFSRQNDQIDLIGMMATDDPNLATIKEKGYFVDLSGSSVLMAQVNRLFPKLRDAAFTKEGKLAMWPIHVQQFLAGGELELLHEHGLTFPTTMDELLDQIDQLDQAGVFSGGEYVPFGTMAYNQRELIGYVMNRFLFEQEIQDLPIDYDNEVLRSLLQRILDTVPREDPYPMATGEESAVYSLYNVYVPVTRNALPPIKINPASPTAIETLVHYVVINPYSRQKEEAMRYLEFISQVDGMEAYALFSDMTDTLPNPDAAASLAEAEQEIQSLHAQGDSPDNQEQLAELEEQRAFLQAHMDIIGQADLAAIQSFAPQMVVQERTLEGEEISTYMDQLVSGNITLDAFIAQCNHYIQMRTAED